MSAVDPVQTPKVKRSQFIDKLHDLLDNPLDPDSLRWSPDGTAFEITTHEAKAKAALSPKWDFRSLSSFIRQLSYYNFKRLSDRRRSSERRGSATSYIVFHHPSGFFVRGDKSRLDGIVRKTRPKTPQSRRQSIVSNLSTDGSSGVADAAQAGPSGLPSPSSPFSYTPVPGLAKSYQGPPATHDSAWRPYHSTGWPPAATPSPFAQQQQVYNVAPVPGSLPPLGFDPTLPPLDQQNALRRSSLSEFKISPEPKAPDLQTNAQGQAYLPNVGQMQHQQPHASFAFPALPFPHPAFHAHAPPPQPHYDHYQHAQHLPADPHAPTYPSGLPFSFDPTQPRGSGSSYGSTSFSSRSSGQSLIPPLHPQARLSIAAGAVPSPPYSYSSASASAEDDGSVPPQTQAQAQGSYPPSRQGDYPYQQQADYRRGSIHDLSAVDPHHQSLDPHAQHQTHHQLPPLPLQTQQYNPSPAAMPAPPSQSHASGGPQLLHPQPRHQALMDWRQGGGDPAGQFGGWAGFAGGGGGGNEEGQQGEGENAV
ncbi:heat shock transcription factor [Rhodotorula toruloides]|uniref:Heat shock transcription factor n=1 Tax=Rhodotorula toruloides TaxID=5286 RepID=A0A511KHW1_RHOTO|nr:heat shock transcription factor [Rhodotorula toruloides]